MDGYLSTNIEQLRESINDLPTKSNLIKNLLMKSFLESLGNSMDRAVLRFVVDRERE